MPSLMENSSLKGHISAHIFCQNVNNPELATNGDVVCRITETYEKTGTHLRGE